MGFGFEAGRNEETWAGGRGSVVFLWVWVWWGSLASWIALASTDRQKRGC
jgi:hypothetical protein